MSKVYFDDLFLIMDDGFILCEHIPYERHNIVLHVKTKHEYTSTKELLCKIILSDEFKVLNLNVVGMPLNCLVN